MRAIIFSPIDGTSAEAEATSLIVGSLRVTGVEVVVVGTELDELAQSGRHPSLRTSLHWTDTAEVQGLVDASSLVVHKIDADAQRFAGAQHWLDRVGGIACVSEAPDDGVLSPAEAGASRRAFIEWISRRASAVVLSSTAELALAKATCGGIVQVLTPPLDQTAPDQTARDQPASRAPAKVTRTHSGLIVLSHGETRPAATIDAVIRAVSSEPTLAAAVEYRVAAELDEDLRDYFVNTAAKNGVALELLGALDDEALAAEINAADVVCQLQIPTTADQSRSLLYGLRNGTPLIVASVAIPSDLPDGAVTTVPASARVESLRLALLRINSQPDAARDAGIRGATWALRQLRIDEYTSGLLSLAEAVDGYEQSLAIATHWTRNLAAWHVSPASPLLGELSTIVGFFENSTDTAAT
jgi:hypothetical protein